MSAASDVIKKKFRQKKEWKAAVARAKEVNKNKLVVKAQYNEAQEAAQKAAEDAKLLASQIENAATVGQMEPLDPFEEGLGG